MIDPTQLLIFIPAALALNLTPGSDMLFCLGQGVKSGPKAGLFASLGIATGGLIHSVLAALGLAALLASYPFAFETIRWGGVAYLIWLAIQTFLNRHQMLQAESVKAGSSFKAWRDGTVVNFFNPKIAIFILAFVPQFVDPTRGSTIIQFLIFGMILNIGGTIINALVGVFAGSVGRIFTTHKFAATSFAYLSSFIFLGLAAKLAFAKR